MRLHRHQHRRGLGAEIEVPEQRRARHQRAVRVVRVGREPPGKTQRALLDIAAAPGQPNAVELTRHVRRRRPGLAARRLDQAQPRVHALFGGAVRHDAFETQPRDLRLTQRQIRLAAIQVGGGIAAGKPMQPFQRKRRPSRPDRRARGGEDKARSPGLRTCIEGPLRTAELTQRLDGIARLGHRQHPP